MIDEYSLYAFCSEFRNTRSNLLIAHIYFHIVDCYAGL